MFLLLALAILPAAALGIGNALMEDGRRRAAEQATITAALVAVGDNYRTMLSGSRQLLDALAALDATRSLDRESCQPVMANVSRRLTDQYVGFAALNRDGQVVCSIAPGDPGARYDARINFIRARETRAFAVGTFAAGDLTGERILPLSTPIIVNGEFRGMVNGALRVSWLLNQATRESRFAGVDTFVVDANGASVPEVGERGYTLPARERLVAALAAAGGIVAQDGDAPGRIYGVVALDGGGLLAVATAPTDPSATLWSAPLMRGVTQILLWCLLVFTAVGIGIHLLVARPINSFMHALAVYRRSDRLPDTKGPAVPEEIVALGAEFEALLDKVHERQRRLEDSLGQRDLLLREIHHRVKNNLQIISSLLTLQAARIKSPAAQLEFHAARDRVQALSLLHQHLYAEPELQAIDFRGFSTQLCDQLKATYGDALGERVKITCAAPSLRLASERAVALGLIIAEAVANALRFAFPGERSGAITVMIEESGGRAKLTIADDGIGGVDPTPGHYRGLGLELIRGFAAQLGGALKIETNDGTRLTVEFPLATPAPQGG